MFSLDNFYYITYYNFLQPFGAIDHWFKKFGSTQIEDLISSYYSKQQNVKVLRQSKMLVLFYDQEPLYQHNIDTLLAKGFKHGFASRKPSFFKILANSEHSNLKNNICQTEQFYDWYYFFHGFAALEWYRDFKYLPNTVPNFTKVFISLNHLISKDRSYRLNLVAQLKERDLIDHGIVSCGLHDSIGSWRDEILSETSKLSTSAKKLIYTHFRNLEEPLVVDRPDPCGTMSANLNFDLQKEAFAHIVSETIFYEEKLHLTEKIFKPIIAHRPFMLLAAPGNLEYLKSYGFKTFDQWWDESYDTETDPDLRIKKVVDNINMLCQLSDSDLKQMYNEMLPVLEHNFNHFYYGEFQKIIVQEMSDNFEKVLKQMNVGHLPENQIDITKYSAQEVIRRLSR